MEFSGLLLILSFLLLLLMRVPVAICIGAATFVAMLASIEFTAAATTVAQRMAGGLDSFALLAVPLFIMSGILMGQGGIARRLIEFAKVLVGTLPGGLGLVNVISCTLFGSISGSAVAATSAIGGFMIPAMEKDGYNRNFNAALTITSSTTGLLIPPSNVLIIYSLASGSVSIAALFIAGYVPGILLALSLMAIAMVYSSRAGFPRSGRIPLRQAMPKLLDAIPSLLLVVIVIGGIIGGVFTATEASAIAVLYSLILAVGVYREVKPKELPALMIKTAETSAVVLLLIATSTAMSWMLAYENIPQSVSELLIGLSDNPLMILLLINIVLLLVGTFMDMTPAILIFTPIFLPIAESLGISPLHFGIMMVLNLSVGLCTPPVGSVLFVGCSIAKTRVESVLKPLLPMYAAMLFTLLLVILFPDLSEWLPRVSGLID